MEELVWKPAIITLGEIHYWEGDEPWERNPKYTSKKRGERLLTSWKKHGQFQTLAVGPAGELYDGHQRVRKLRAAGYPRDYEIYVMQSNRPLTQEERAAVILDSTLAVGRFDWEVMGEWSKRGMLDGWFDEDLSDEWGEDASAAAGIVVDRQGAPDLDELAEEYGEPGERDFWPRISLRVSPDTHELFQRLMSETGIDDEALAFAALLDRIDA